MVAATSTTATATSAAPASARGSSPGRSFGRFELRQLLGRSDLTMAWLAWDGRAGNELILNMPRVQPADARALDAWLDNARKAARLDHPQLARVVEVGTHEQWPYLTVDRANGQTLAERLAAQAAPAPAEAVKWVVHALEGLAFAHEAGSTHGDLQLHQLLVNEQGQLRVMALSVAGEPADASTAGTFRMAQSLAVDPGQLRAQRASAERDVLAVGLLLHALLAGASPLDESDLSRVIQRMPPKGRERVHLPWTTPHPLPEPLRAIGNRAAAAEERRRYLGARSLLRALQGWLEAQATEGGGPLALLLDRIRTVGSLPALPDVGARVAKLSAMEGQHTEEIAEQILQDMGLSFELLRQVNSAQVQGTQLAGAAPVLTVRRAVALVGLNGVRAAGNGLRIWPGPMSESAAAALHRVMEQARLAALTAQIIRPAGYDPEVCYLLTLLQSLGRLLVQYHFNEEAEQIRLLMRPLPPPANAEPGTPEQPGMSEQGASYAVLGVDTETLGAAVIKQWGLGPEMQHMVHRLPLGRPVRTPDSDADLLRATASAANEAVDALLQAPPGKAQAALDAVAQRYAKTLALEPRSLTEALQQARGALRGHRSSASSSGAVPAAASSHGAAPAAATAPADRT